jgi:hypothetical protein
VADDVDLVRLERAVAPPMADDADLLAASQLPGRSGKC